ncbi:MAG: NAD-dependent deacylase [Thermoplasmata archaeon]|nr:MAG: NAD-dependent deacylase [Thermoplasmata archaeon]
MIVTEADKLPEELIDVFVNTKYLVVLTGAGVSAESGMPTFRGEDGFWRKYNAMDLATPEAFANDPKLVWEWYDYRRGILDKTGPNRAHEVIAEMEKHYPQFKLITQNVDGLHARAGSNKIIEIHGNLWRVKCQKCDYNGDFMEVPLKSNPPRCKCGGFLRPDVVWFGESLPMGAIDSAVEALRACDTVLTVGTSGVVQPAASFPLIAHEAGAAVIESNIEPTPITSICKHAMHGKATVLLDKLWNAVIEMEK